MNVLVITKFSKGYCRVGELVGKVNFAGLILNRIKLNSPIHGTIKFVHVVDGGYLAIKG